MFFLNFVLFSAVPFAVVTGLGARLGWYGRGLKGAVLGITVAPALLVFLPLLQPKVLLWPTWPWYCLLAFTSLILVWPQQRRTWRNWKASRIKEKRYKKRWQSESWAKRWTMSFANTKSRFWSLSRFLALCLLVFFSPACLMVVESLVGSLTSLRLKLLLLPSLGDWEFYVLLLAAHGVLVGVGVYLWHRVAQPVKTFVWYSVGAGLALGLICGLTAAWTQAWRPSEIVSLEPAGEGQLTYTIWRIPTKPFDGAIHVIQEYEFGLLDLQSGEQKLLIDSTAIPFPQLSPDQKVLSFARDDRFFVKYLASGEDVEIGPSDGVPSWNKESLLFTDESKSLNLFNTSDKSQRLIVSEAERPNMSAQGDRLVFTRPNELQTQRLWIVDTQGGSARPLDGPPIKGSDEGDHRFLSWSPDGRWIVYGERTSSPNDKRQYDLWLLDLNDGSQHLLTENCFSPMSTWSASGKLLVKNGEETKVWSPENLTNRILKHPLAYKDSKGENRNYRIEWLATSERILFTDSDNDEVYVSAILDQDWTECGSDPERGFQ